MTNTLFISESYLTSHSPVTLDTQFKDYAPHIRRAQDLFLRVIIGSSFMEDLKTKYKNQNLSTEEVELVHEYIKPAVLWRALALGAPFIQYNLRTGGGYQKTTLDNSEGADIIELKYIISELKKFSSGV